MLLEMSLIYSSRAWQCLILFLQTCIDCSSCYMVGSCLPQSSGGRSLSIVPLIIISGQQSTYILFAMVDIQKQIPIKGNCHQHRPLLKKYQAHCSPLILPKLAVTGYQLAPDPSCRIFFSQLGFHDKAVIMRENKLIDFVKKSILQSCRPASKTNSQMSLFEVLKLVEEGQARFQGEYDKGKYNQILKNRLKDLKEWIYHIERHNKQPLHQKELSSLLEREINRIDIEEAQKMKKTVTLTASSRKKEQTPQYFNLVQFKRSQKKQKEDNIKQMYRKDRQNKKHEKYMSSLSKENGSTLPFSSLCSHDFATTAPRPSQQFSYLLRKSEDEARRGKKEANRKNSELIRLSLASDSNLYQQTQRGFNKKRHDLHQKPALIQRTSSKHRSSRKQLGKSVRYMDHQSSEIDEQNRLLKNRNSKIPSRFRKQSTLKTNPSEKSLRRKGASSKLVNNSKNNLSQSHEANSIIQREEHSQQSAQESQAGQMRSREDSQSLLSSKKSFMPGKQQSIRPGIMRRQKPKISAFFYQQQQEEEQECVIKNHYSVKSSKRQVKILRRDAQIIESPPPHSSQLLKKSKKVKRVGRILRKEASKNFERLLTSQNLQDLLLAYDEEEPFEPISRQFLLNRSRCKVMGQASKDLSKTTSKHTIVNQNKNKIMMEVDLDADHAFYNQLKNKSVKNLVDNLGFAVQWKDLTTLKSQISEANPYPHLTIAQYYGGPISTRESEFQIVKDDSGHFTFNRQFVKNIQLSQQDEVSKQHHHHNDFYFQNLAIELGKSLTRECQDLEQKTIIESSILV